MFSAGVRKMNIIIGIAVFAAAFYMRLRYRKQTRNEKELFWLSITAGVISILTIESYATFWQMLWSLADIALSAAILLLYHTEIMRRIEAHAQHRVQARRAAELAAEKAQQEAYMRSRASVAAMWRYNSDNAEDSAAA